METYRVTESSEVWKLAGVHAVRVDAFVIGQNIPIQFEFDEEAGGPIRYILLTDSGRPVASCRLHLLDGETGKIERVCVVRSLQNTGVGRVLIASAEDWARELDIKKIIITSQTQALGFYERLGYKADRNVDLGKGGNGLGITCVYTEKILNVR